MHCFHSLEVEGRQFCGFEGEIKAVGQGLISYDGLIYDVFDFPEKKQVWLDVQQDSEPVCEEGDLSGQFGNFASQQPKPRPAEIFSNVKECPDVQGFGA